MVRSLLLVVLVLPPASWAAEPRCARERTPVSEWVAHQVHQATFVFYGTVTYVEPPLPSSGETFDIQTITVLENYKGSFGGGRLKPSDTGWGVLPGESAVFFVDSASRVLPCSSYQHYLSDFGVIDEVRQALVSGT